MAALCIPKGRSFSPLVASFLENDSGLKKYGSYHPAVVVISQDTSMLYEPIKKGAVKVHGY
ncbi:uncharacterized protein BDCG_17730 [Blastomyces dermatitidis ER-3]|uniref:Uncharacterized protein n=3 Tax=Blastomyces TaxID=229219 RepID=A0A179UQ20_BLAGS|nr:uncharacterized protein BDBG_17053 [Blastomyces gilchristii SLH14081]XP_045282425.1 uncharacterized protein BDCG_17730 [Blastomyces dermatitidis ER-3]EQL36841.1 hypothetical protein BDFG_01793 [Blastomyces dermatitidis ATCC 26199]KMW68415.1 hypothetical protein BDDG_12806 [Blastomyces dermatitidis ATCC 18188]OAT02698.1 hypothetical protein BDCG_17730 [Blastomyces dermatitidis ER-3]OAT08482.1 hypothetical protein BDBG_17053 [Blastomyces gilchristii SLH14081]